MMIRLIDLIPQRGSELHRALRLIRSIWFPTTLALICLAYSTYLSHLEGRTTILSLCAILAGTIFLFDAMARGSMFLYYSTTNRVLNSLRIMMNCRKSFCSRQVAIALYGKTAQKFYKEMGYRWYHLTPDGTFSFGSPFFKTTFWKQVFKPTL